MRGVRESYIDQKTAQKSISAIRSPKLPEKTFGLLGLVLGLVAFLMCSYSTTFTKICTIIQSLLGLHELAVFVFALPAIQAHDLSAPTINGLMIGQSRFLIPLGTLISFHFSMSQGGQFVLFLRLVSAATCTFSVSEPMTEPELFHGTRSLFFQGCGLLSRGHQYATESVGGNW